MRKTITIGLMLLFMTSVFGQEKSFKYRGAIDYGFMRGILNFNVSTDSQGGRISTTEDILGHSIRTLHGVVFKNKIFLGIGAGLESYSVKENSNAFFNALPIYFNTKYYFSKKRNNFHVGMNLGHSFRIQGGGAMTKEWTGGFLFNPEIGYKFKILQKLDMNLTLNYVHQNISAPDKYLGLDFIQKPQFRTAHFRVGFVF